MQSEIETLRDEEQDYFDNMHDGLKSSEKGENAETAISALDSAISNVETAIEELDLASQ